MKYFHNCTSLEQARALYIKLVMQYHPDRPTGDLEIMKAINLEWEIASKKRYDGDTSTSEEFQQTVLNMQAYKDAVNAVINLDEIVIELVGSWLWVTGNTRKHVKAMNASPFSWARKKTDMSAWFFRTAENKAMNKGRKMDLEEIRKRHGSQVINGRFQTQLN